MTVERQNKGWSNWVESSFKEELPNILERGMLKVEDMAKRIVYLGHPDHLNKITGLLGGSIVTASGWDENTAYAVVGTPVVYAPTHEFGAVIQHGNRTVRIPARPFLIPAFESMKHAVVAEVREGLKKLLGV